MERGAALLLRRFLPQPDRENGAGGEPRENTSGSGWPITDRYSLRVWNSRLCVIRHDAEPLQELLDEADDRIFATRCFALHRECGRGDEAGRENDNENSSRKP